MPRFITVPEALALHDLQVRKFGGIAAAAALTFLDLNGIEIAAEEDALYDLVSGVAEGRITKDEIAAFFETHAV